MFRCCRALCRISARGNKSIHFQAITISFVVKTPRTLPSSFLKWNVYLLLEENVGNEKLLPFSCESLSGAFLRPESPELQMQRDGLSSGGPDMGLSVQSHRCRGRAQEDTGLRAQSYRCRGQAQEDCVDFPQGPTAPENTHGDLAFSWTTYVFLIKTGIKRCSCTHIFFYNHSEFKCA